MSNKPLDVALYNQVKRRADRVYAKPSAYKSGWITKTYKSLGGRFSGGKTTQGLTRWFKEKWRDIGHRAYPVYRPTRVVNAQTPLTKDEISPAQLKRQITLKQRIKGDQNLPPFIPKQSGRRL
jgi:hypothetical protein